MISPCVQPAIPDYVSGYVISFNNRYWSTTLTQPMASLTYQVYTYAKGAHEDWHRQAWAGALVLVTMVLVCSVLARLATRRLERMHAR